MEKKLYKIHLMHYQNLPKAKCFIHIYQTVRFKQNLSDSSITTTLLLHTIQDTIHK